MSDFGSDGRGGKKGGAEKPSDSNVSTYDAWRSHGLPVPPIYRKFAGSSRLADPSVVPRIQTFLKLHPEASAGGEIQRKEAGEPDPSSKEGENDAQTQRGSFQQKEVGHAEESGALPANEELAGASPAEATNKQADAGEEGHTREDSDARSNDEHSGANLGDSSSLARKAKGDGLPSGRVFRTPIIPAGGGGGRRRPNDGLNVKPMLGKLDQAHAMFVMWAQRGTVPEAQQVLAALGAAKDKAHELDERVESGRIEAIDVLKADLSQRLQQIQKLDPGYELFSIGAMAITINLATRRMPVVSPPAWKCARPAALGAYRAALSRQQDGINAMTADQWDKNKAQYTDVGRSDEGTRLQDVFNQRSRLPNGALQGDAPHNPDQIGAGYPDPTGLPDPVYVNRSIGSYWAKDDRAKMISDAVKAVQPLTRLVSQMNVVLAVS